MFAVILSLLVLTQLTASQLSKFNVEFALTSMFVSLKLLLLDNVSKRKNVYTCKLTSQNFLQDFINNILKYVDQVIFGEHI